ncbi:MAG: hypothetical protein EAZ54_00260 [Curvibacter sp.]|nr:MAG: hypothetical protein EAZ54_00260 [Curvibacter sp.]
MSSAPVHDDQPLGLTVHSLPEPSGQLQTAAVDTRGGRLRMLLVMLVCAAPVIASYFTYYVIRPEGRRNFGELIDPQRPLPVVEAKNLTGESVMLPTLKGQWLFVSVAGGACEAQCQQHLYLQRQLRETLGKEKDRLDRVWLINDDAPVPPEIIPALKDATVLRVPPAALAQWLQAGEGHALNEHLYVVDPLGNWMMRFPAGLNAETALKAKRDLDQLMRAARFWDRAGRD